MSKGLFGEKKKKHKSEENAEGQKHCPFHLPIIPCVPIVWPDLFYFPSFPRVNFSRCFYLKGLC